MGFVVTGTPTQAFVDAVKAALEADPALMALVTGVFGHLKETARQAYPYVVLGRRGRSNDAGAMQVAGSVMSLQIDAWSAHQGASEMHAITSRVYAVLERKTLTVAGYEMVRGSLTCEFEDVFDEPDPDIPTRALYHGVQRWVCEIHETS